MTELKDKQSIKDVFFEEVDSSIKYLIRKVISPTSVGVVIIAWVIASLGISIYVRKQNLCDKPRVELGKYLKSRLLCEIKEN